MSLADLDWAAVRQHLDDRVATHRRLVELHDDGAAKPFFKLALGISDRDGNYSAAQWSLGPKIEHSNGNALRRVFDLASRLRAVKHGREVPAVIKAAGLAYLGIAVGSEMSCMLNPETCWVANVRTVWAHLLVKHRFDYAKADEALALYRDHDATSEMDYRIWSAIHRDMGPAMTDLADRGVVEATRCHVVPGGPIFLWADAIADALYAEE